MLADPLLAAAATTPGGVLHMLASVVCADHVPPTPKAAALALLATALQRGQVQADETLTTVLLLAASSGHAAVRSAAVQFATVRWGDCCCGVVVLW